MNKSPTKTVADLSLSQLAVSESISTGTGDSAAITPTSTSSASDLSKPFLPDQLYRGKTEPIPVQPASPKAMDQASTEDQPNSTESGQRVEKPADTNENAPEKDKTATKSTSKKSKCRKADQKKEKAKKKGKKTERKSGKKPKNVSSSSEDSSENESDSESEESESDEDDESADDSSSASSSEDESRRKKKKSSSRRKSKGKSKKKDKHGKRSKKAASDSSSDDSSSSASESETSDSEAENNRTRRKKKSSRRSARKIVIPDPFAELDVDAEQSDDLPTMREQLNDLVARINEREQLELSMPKSISIKSPRSRRVKVVHQKLKPPKRKADALQYRRVDQLWDSSIHNYKLKESAEDDEGEFAEYAFLVRRRFNWENQYMNTVIDIKSKQLRAVLAVVMKDCKSVSLETAEPEIDPNFLFIYLEDLRTYYRKTLKRKIAKEKKKKTLAKLKQQRALCKTLVSWIDEDYADTKKRLYPLLEAGNITFDLVWALFSPNDIAITSTYGVWDEPRCFKVDYALKYSSFGKGEWYGIEGKYVEFDGKDFGMGDYGVDIEAFKGPRKITSLAAYPIKYHRDPEGIKKQIVTRAEKFVAFDGMHYKFHKGLAFLKKKRQALKISINGRIMVDPATFRRINPNYPISNVKTKDEDDLFAMSDDEDDCSCGGHGDEGGDNLDANADEKPPKVMYKWVEDNDGNATFVAVEVDEDGKPIQDNSIDKIAATSDGRKLIFTKELLLITSSVVLGFSFSEKLWLEFTLSGVHEIVYDDDAFDSLVVPTKEKSIVRALVESHKFHASRTIDDVIQGKGKGMVAVLHGPPGVGKTLTAEGISELLKCPLYMVSAGELGTDPGRLELELQKILDIAHSWGAVLLLDEADVFLEKRETHDIHRNALVSIFLRLLEYFQGILILTTNRVETFDSAFQSRIHLALHYPELQTKAKIAIWQTHLDRVRAAAASSATVSMASSTHTTASTASSTGTPSASTSSTTAPSSPPATPTPAPSSTDSAAPSTTSTSASVSTTEDPALAAAKKAAATRAVTVTDADLVGLARHNLNGRQIKNAVRTAQALALHESGKDADGAVLTLEHIRRVLEVQETFERDLKGGSGYLEAMRSYT